MIIIKKKKIGIKRSLGENLSETPRVDSEGENLMEVPQLSLKNKEME